MRFIKWIVMLLALLVLILQIFYNFKSLTENTFSFAFQLLPGNKIFERELPVWQGLLVVFMLGFGLAFLFEIYYWARYTLRIRSQNRIITRLQKAVDSIRPSHGHEPKPKEQTKPGEKQS